MASRVMTIILLFVAAVLGAGLVLSAAIYNEAMFTANPYQPARVPAPITNVR